VTKPQRAGTVINSTPDQLKNILAQPIAREEMAGLIAETILNAGDWRWVGIYDVDTDLGLVTNVAWRGPAGPVFLTFPISKGLTSRAITTKKTVSVGDVSKDADYLEALSATQSEIIIPILHPANRRVIGTIDVESERRNAFASDAQALLESYAKILKSFWTAGSQP
jgi:L-methionine (R)-S-oxide reductase